MSLYHVLKNCEHEAVKFDKFENVLGNEIAYGHCIYCRKEVVLDSGYTHFEENIYLNDSLMSCWDNFFDFFTKL